MEAVIEKIDLIKEDPNYYKAGKTPEIKDLDTYYYLTTSGKSSPESARFLNAIEQIYAFAYAIKFTCKSEDNDFVVPKMEAYWWIDGDYHIQHLFAQTPREEWNWKLVMRMPDFVELEHFNRACEKLKLKNPTIFTGHVKYELINDGMCIQALHIGGYEEEEPTISAIMQYIATHGLQVNGYHHEIYLSDPRRTSPEKLRTILRYAVKKA